jgi:hypothetical protein
MIIATLPMMNFLGNSSMKISERLIEKIEFGDPITDKELRDAIAFYGDLVESLDCLGKEYNLAKRPVREILYRLQGFQVVREQRIKA